MRRWGVVLGSVAFHALLVLLFVLDIGKGPTTPAWRPMTVWMERPPETPPKARARASRGGSRAAEPRIDAPAASALATSDIPAAPATSQGVAPAPGPALKGLGGCRLATLDRLPVEERARCQERLAQSMDAGRAPRPNLDPTGRYARDDRPYLTRPPKNGCKPVGSIEPGLLGAADAKLGVGCAWSF